MAMTCSLNLGDGYIGVYGNILSVFIHYKIHSMLTPLREHIDQGFILCKTPRFERHPSGTEARDGV